MSQSFIKYVENYHINESDNQSSVIDSILKGLSRDLKFNYALVFTFGAGIKAMFPIVENLIKNEKMNQVL
jgi:Na+-transporting NADH:ubiquinone oxidoreductase subunit NqrE